MKRALLMGLLVSQGAMAQGFNLDSPFKDDRRNVVGRLGSSPLTLSGRGQYTTGQATAGTFTQGGGEISAEFAVVGFPTSLGGMFGFEGEFNVGLTRSEEYADGTLKDQRSSTDRDDPAKMWLTTRLGARLVVSPTPLTFGNSAFRLGLVGGLQLEGSGARSWEMGGAFTAGAHVAFGTGAFAAQLSWLSIPPQGDDVVLIRHLLGLDVGIGPVALGARLQFDTLDIQARRGNPAAALTSQTFSLSVGYRFDALKI